MEFLLAKPSRMPLLFVAVFLFAAGDTIHAQDPTGKIVGTVIHPQGAGIPGAEVKVTNVATQVTKRALTDEEGFYQILDLPIGSYKVTMQRQDFRQLVFNDQVLQINQSLRIDGKLDLGTRTEIVEVGSRGADRDSGPGQEDVEFGVLSLTGWNAVRTAATATGSCLKQHHSGNRGDRQRVYEEMKG
jgi:hypothetical protein